MKLDSGRTKIWGGYDKEYEKDVRHVSLSEHRSISVGEHLTVQGVNNL